jgi:hypothetical protein
MDLDNPLEAGVLSWLCEADAGMVSSSLVEAEAEVVVWSSSLEMVDEGSM